MAIKFGYDRCKIIVIGAKLFAYFQVNNEQYDWIEMSSWQDGEKSHL